MAVTKDDTVRGLGGSESVFRLGRMGFSVVKCVDVGVSTRVTVLL